MIRFTDAEDEFLVKVASIVAEKARAKAPQHLKDKIVVSPVYMKDGVKTIKVSVDDPTAIFFEEGTQPHTIYPKSKRVLSFEWDGAPPEVKINQKKFPLVFYKRVSTLGIKAQPFMKPALEESRDEILAVAATIFRR